MALCVLAGVQGADSAELPEIVELVKAKGWRANLGRLCQEFSLEPFGTDCIFKQISVEEVQGRGDPRGFNVRAGVGEVTYVLIFHLGPLVGEFFVASPQGELLRAFIRTKGRDYEQISNAVIHGEFLMDVAYWKDNFTRIRAGLDRQNGPPR
jgi:hypothetical protein